jgi:uncharacterized protein (DUF433 family)
MTRQKRTKLTSSVRSPKSRGSNEDRSDTWSPEFLAHLGSWPHEIERPPPRQISEMRDPFSLSPAETLLRDARLLPKTERLEIASRLSAQENSVISAHPSVMSGAPVFKGTRVLVQTLIEYLEAGDTINDFLEGFPSVSREQVIAFLEEAKAPKCCPMRNENPG